MSLMLAAVGIFAGVVGLSIGLFAGFKFGRAWRETDKVIALLDYLDERKRD